MLTCKEAHALIAHAVEGRIALRVFDPLRQHLAVCSSCREALDTQRRVKAVLAARPPEGVPAGFAARLAARLDAEPVPNPLVTAAPPVRELTLLASSPARAAWRDTAAWRTWSLRLLPVAAALVLFLAPELRRESNGPAGRADASAAPGSADEHLLEWLGRPGTTLDSLLVTVTQGSGTSRVANSSPAGAVATPGSARADAGAASGPAAAGLSAADGRPVADGGAGSDRAAFPAASAAGGAGLTPVSATRGIGTGAGVGVDRVAAGGGNGVPAIHAAPALNAPSGAAAAGMVAAVGSSSAGSASVSASAGHRAVTPADWPAPMAAGPGGLPGTVVPNAVPTALAGQMAQELRLTDAQRKKIEAIYDAQRQKLSEILESNRQRLAFERQETDEAVEKVLTPRQRQRYRDMNANRGPALPLNDPNALPPAVLPNGLELTITPTPPPPFR